MSSSKLTLSKASLVGAKRVKGPAEARVSTRPAAFTAANKVENLKKNRISGKHFQILDALLGIRQERVAQFFTREIKVDSDHNIRCEFTWDQWRQCLRCSGLE